MMYIYIRYNDHISIYEENIMYSIGYRNIVHRYNNSFINIELRVLCRRAGIQYTISSF